MLIPMRYEACNGPIILATWLGPPLACPKATAKVWKASEKLFLRRLALQSAGPPTFLRRPKSEERAFHDIWKHLEKWKFFWKIFWGGRVRFGGWQVLTLGLEATCQACDGLDRSTWPCLDGGRPTKPMHHLQRAPWQGLVRLRSQTCAIHQKHSRGDCGEGESGPEPPLKPTMDLVIPCEPQVRRGARPGHMPLQQSAAWPQTCGSDLDSKPRKARPPQGRHELNHSRGFRV